MRGFAISDSPVFQATKTARLSTGYDVPATTALNGDLEPTLLLNLNSESFRKALAGGPFENTVIHDGQPYTYDHFDRHTGNAVFIHGQGPLMTPEARIKLAALGKQLEQLLEADKAVSDVHEGDEHIATFVNEGGFVPERDNTSTPKGPFLDGRYRDSLSGEEDYIHVAGGNVVGITNVPPLLLKLSVEIGNNVLRGLLADKKVDYEPYPETADGIWFHPAAPELWVRIRNEHIVASNDGHVPRQGDDQYLKYLIFRQIAVFAPQNSVANYPTGAEGEPLQQVGQSSFSCR